MSYLPLLGVKGQSFITSLSIESVSPECFTISSNPSVSIGGNTWDSANMAIYVPFILKCPVTTDTMFTFNGTGVSGNVDIGIYSVDGTRIVSKGSTAQSGTSTLQGYSITSTNLGPGAYFMALVGSTATTARFVGMINARGFFLRVLGCFQQASALPLPATATFAACTTLQGLPLFGFITKPSTVL